MLSGSKRIALLETRLLTGSFGVGLHYTKPHQYLAIALADSGLDFAEVKMRVAPAVSGKKP